METAPGAPGAALVGVDLGGTKIAAALVAPDGALLGPVADRPTPAHDGPEAMLDAIAGLVLAVLAAGTHERPGESVAPIAVGIGSAGVIDPASGTVVSATDAITGWPGTHVADGVAARLAKAPGLVGRAVPVHVDNDVNAYASGEAWLGAGRGAETVLVVAAGTGIGAALVIDGRVRSGAHCVAGEIGHMPAVGAEGEPCTCGRPGHLEAVAAGPQIHRRYLAAGGDPAVRTALEVERRADAGDAVAAAVYRDSAMALARSIAGIVTVLDPERVIVSGGLARAGELWWGPLRATLAAELIDALGDVEIRPAELGTTAPIIGAAHEAWLSLPDQG